MCESANSRRDEFVDSFGVKAVGDSRVHSSPSDDEPEEEREVYPLSSVSERAMGIDDALGLVMK